MAVRMRRFDEQRWVLDNIIKANGPEWDQARLASLNSAIGTEGNADMAALRTRITRLSDIAPAFEALAKRREGRARDAEAEGQTVLARDNYFIAANYWASAQWPHDENNDENLAFNAKKRDCYTRYAALADHHVEAAWIPFKGKALPGWLHLPATAQRGKTPIVVAIPGMDGYKERSVALYGDRWLNRGIGVLVIEGPGQYESAVLGIHVSMENWVATGPAVMDWLLQRPEVDPARIGINGQSFGSFFGSICFANEKRFAAAAVSGTVFEPGCRTLFEEASPTFKKRFMYMSGYEDEAAFDAFAKTLTWEPHVGKIDRPAVPLRRLRRGRIVAARTHGLLCTRDRGAETIAGLSGYAPQRCRLACDKSRAFADAVHGRMDGGAFCRKAIRERTLARRPHRAHQQDGVLVFLFSLSWPPRA